MSEATEEVYAALKHSFRGSLMQPDDAEYPNARRIWNGLVTRRPGLIARCNDSSDVQAAVRAAASANVITAVRCGGHSLGGFSSCDDGIVIDLSPMRKVQVYEEDRSARFEGGCLLGSIDSATQTVGLAFPAGVVSHTGRVAWFSEVAPGGSIVCTASLVTTCGALPSLLRTDPSSARTAKKTRTCFGHCEGEEATLAW